MTAIKGIGEKTAFAMDMPDVSNFEKSGQFAAFVGVTPTHKESRTSVLGKSHISKIGTQSVRKVLYMSAINVKNHNPHFQKFMCIPFSVYGYVVKNFEAFCKSGPEF